MKSNVEIIQEVFEQIVNQKKIDQWEQYFSPDYISRGAPYIGMGFSRDTCENTHIINMIVPGSPADITPIFVTHLVNQAFNFVVELLSGVFS